MLGVIWFVPLAVAAVVFAAVLQVTPPGFASIPDVLVGSTRGPNAEAAAYALGAAASLALVALGALSGVCAVIHLLRRRM